jgi:hypothetical protein
MVRPSSTSYTSRVINYNAEHQYDKQLALDGLDRQSSWCERRSRPEVVSIRTLEK